MTLNAFAKLHWLTTVDIMWLKATHAFSQPLFCGPTGTDQDSGRRRCDERAGGQKMRTLSQGTASIACCVT